MSHKLTGSSGERPKTKVRGWGKISGHLNAKPASAILEKPLDLSGPQIFHLYHKKAGPKDVQALLLH